MAELLFLLVGLLSWSSCSSSSPKARSGGTTALFAPCISSDECASDLCLAGEGFGYCSESCGAGTCPPGSSCAPSPSGMACLQTCTGSVSQEYVCENGVPQACSQASPAHCDVCGCSSSLRCIPGTGCAPLAALGQACSMDSDCNTGNCSPLFHVCRVPAGTACDTTNCDTCLTSTGGYSFCSPACESSDDCNGGVCLGGTCSPGCESTAQQNSCPGTCRLTSDSSEIYCDCEFCTSEHPLRGDGLPCGGNEDCAGGLCLMAGTGPGSCSKPCALASDCASGLACVATLCPDGSAAACDYCLPTCGDDAGSCSNGTCRVLASSAGLDVEACDPRSANGGSCSNASECLSGRCSVDKCEPQSGTPNGSACQSSPDCQSNNCVNGTCAGSALLGDTCASSSDCEVGTCCGSPGTCAMGCN